MKHALVQTLEQGGNTYGQVTNPNDLMKAQEFVHDRVTGVTKDFLNGTTAPDIKGFSFSLGSGNAFNMTVQAPGRIYESNGVSYDLLSNATVTFDAAHASLPRHDLVIVKIEDELDAEPDSIPFVRLKTPEEFEDDVPAYPPTNITAPTEKHWKATVQIKKGTASATPEVPVLSAGEIPLYRVMIAAQATSLVVGDVLDLRNIGQTVRELHSSDTLNRNSISDIYRRLVVLEQIGTLLIGIGGNVRSLEEILADLLARTSSSADLPEIRYENPKYDLFEADSAKIQAEDKYISSQGVIDFELGARINFGDAEVSLTPQGIDPDWNPRYETIAGAPVSHVRREVDTTPATVTDLGSDAAPGFSSRLSSLLPARAHTAAAARDDRYIEIFGGMSVPSSDTLLSDWQTYDTENDTIATRTVTGDAIPATRYPVMFPFGDGEHVLVVAATNLTTARWFKCKVDDVNVVSTELTADLPVGTYFTGDLLNGGSIFIIGVTDGGSPTYYFYHIEDNEFQGIGVTAPSDISCPVGSGGFAGCYYRDDEFIFVTANGANDYRTYLYNRLTATIVQLTGINAPFAGRYTNQANWATNFKMANVNNRPLLIGGNVFGPTADQSYAYEFLTIRSATDNITRTYWNESVINVPARYQGTFRSLMGTDNRPTGQGFSLGGRGMVVSDAQPIIYGSAQSGLISTIFGGEEGITLGANSSFATFEVPAFTASTQIGSYFAGLKGRYSNENIKLEVSWNNGDNWHTILPDQSFTVSDSDTPGVRRLRITLYRNGTTTPIITGITESFDEDGAADLETRTVIRVDSPEDDEFYAMYIDRLGQVTFVNTGSNDLLPSSPAKCLLMLIIATSGDGPTLTRLINRRRPVERVTGVKDATTSTAVLSSLAVPFRYFEIRGVVASGKHYYRPSTQAAADPVSGSFRASVTVLKTEVPEGDTYEVVFFG